MSYPGEALTRATDALTNAFVPALGLAQGDTVNLSDLRRMWADLPSVPKLIAEREAGEDVSWPGFDVRTFVRGEESGGRLSVHSMILAPGAELPPHLQETGQVHWFVVGGAVELTIGSVTQTVSGPGYGFAPQGATQAIVNRSSAPAELLVAHTPAGACRAFAAAHQLWLSQPYSDAAAYRAVLSRYGFQFTDGAPAQHDARTNASAPRVDAVIDQFSDFLKLRSRWAQLSPVPKIVDAVRACRNIPVPGQETRVMLSPEEAAGAASVFYLEIEPGFGAPAHHQPAEDEFFFVLQGPLHLKIGDRSTDAARRGAFGYAPMFATHAFNNQTHGELKVFTLNTPGGHDRGFELALGGLTTDEFVKMVPAHGFQFHEPL